MNFTFSPSMFIPISSHPPDESPSSFCQHPGSPGWPQQFCWFFILIALFLIRSVIFSESGRGPERFVKKIPDARSLMPVLPHGVLDYNAGNISIDRETFLIPQSQDMSQGQVCTCDTPQPKTPAICSLLSLKIARGHLLAAGNALIGLGRIWCVQKKPA